MLGVSALPHAMPFWGCSTLCRAGRAFGAPFHVHAAHAVPRYTTLRRYDVTDWAAAKAQFQIASEKGMSQAMLDCDLKGKDWNGQLKYGTSNFYGERGSRGMAAAGAGTLAGPPHIFKLCRV
jgi:hypothetical protein